MNLTWLRYLRLPVLFLFSALIFAPGLLQAQTNPAAATPSPAPTSAAAGTATSTPAPWRLAVNLEGAEKPGEISVGLQIVVVMTLLSLAPTLVMLMTSFTRIVVVLGFLRTAMGLPNAPSNQIITGLALFLTLFVMGPTFEKVNSDALQPYLAGKLASGPALEAASEPVKGFMLK
ncbi:MAG: hypothetical protein WCQ44_06840, partial [Opitutaceae bacterium]